MNIREALIAWAHSEEFQTKLEEAKREIRTALAQAKKPYVAFSGGKDSTCVLHLVLQETPDVMVFHWDYGRYFFPRWLEAEVIENAKKIGAKVLRVESSPIYEIKKREVLNVWGRIFLGKVAPQLKGEGFDLVFVGLRAEESGRRKRRIHARRSLTAIPECYPIASWSWRDVWAYIWSRNLPYPSIYDLYAPVVGWENARLVTFFDHQFDFLGAPQVDGVLLWQFRHPHK